MFATLSNQSLEVMKVAECPHSLALWFGIWWSLSCAVVHEKTVTMSENYQRSLPISRYLSPPLLSTGVTPRTQTHYFVFSLMVFLTSLYLNHYRHPSTLSIEYEEMRTPASNISRFWYKVNNSVWGWQQQWRVRGWEVSNLLIIE